MQKFRTGAIYKIVVYMIMKHRQRKVKCYAIITCIAVSWILIASTVNLVLLNIFAAEICLWFSFAIFYLRWPSRFLYDKANLCKVFISSYRVGSMQKFTAGAIYGVEVYLIVKHGEKED